MTFYVKGFLKMNRMEINKSSIGKKEKKNIGIDSKGKKKKL